MFTPRLALKWALGLLALFALAVAATGPGSSPSVAATVPQFRYAAGPSGGLPAITPTPTVEPEYAVLDYVKTNYTQWSCTGPLGTPGHRYLTDCNPFGYFSHPTDAYIDRYNSPAEAQAAWQNRRDNVCPTYPICFESVVGGYRSYEAGNTAYLYAHYEVYWSGGNWLMGAVSSDDTHFRGAPPVANAVMNAAITLGYLPPGTHTPQPAATHTPTRSPTVWPTATSGTVYDLTGTAAWSSVCPDTVLRMTTHFAASENVTAGSSVMRATNGIGQVLDVPVPSLPANTSWAYLCIVGTCVPSEWITHLPITLTVDVLNQVSESNEGNNTYVLQYPPPMPTPCGITPTATGVPTVEPEYAILQRVKDNHPTWNCVGPLGTPGHRRLEYCLPTGQGHVAWAYVDGYGSPAEAQDAWQHRRDNVCPTYPLCIDSPYRAYQGYEAGNYNYPYAHHEQYLWGNVWLMGSTSQDDTHFWSSPYVARAIIDAAIELGYLAEINPTVTPTATVTPVCTLQFTDVPFDNTFYPFVRCLACRGIVSGYPCGGPGEPCNSNSDPYLRPNAFVTRGQVTKIVSESAGFDDEIPPSQWTFTDVPYGSTFWVWVERLAGREVMAGYPCGGSGEPCDDQQRPYFRPGNGATRGQLTKIISNAAGFATTIPPEQYTFADLPPGHTFWLFIERLLLNRPGAMSGYPCGSVPNEPCDAENRSYFRPNNPLTRGQTSKIASNTFFSNCSP